MQRTLIKDTVGKVGENVLIKGWVNIRRDHGKLIFLDIRDRSGLIQVVVNPKVSEEAHKVATGVRNEFVLEIEGKVNPRQEKQINPNLETGKIELEVTKLLVLNESEALPISIDDTGYDISEDVRMNHRYIDLRRPRLQKNLDIRHKVIKFIRDELDKQSFIEIETPVLSKSTPEGARDYLVPSRLHAGNFYALPQSPQQYKQLFMVSGLERYFQIARCFRDEDTRGDRQPEFTQLDLEMSFVEREDVMQLNEKLLIDIVKNIFPEKKIQETPFPRLSYKEAMEKYGTDRPDLRKDKNDPNLLAFCWVIDFPFFEKNDEGWTFTHNPFSAPKPEFMDDLLNQKNIGEIITSQYDVALNGFEIGGGSIRNHRPEALQAVFEIMGYAKDRIEQNFGHMLKAFSFGAPPHGGIAWGLDRLVTVLQNEPNIREVIAFPKTGDGRDLMMNGPSDVTEKQLKELHIKVEKPKAKKK
jgi:aspartyl-tRNA synthetase